jgi:tetratricopeptide (TPR) repeat protein
MPLPADLVGAVSEGRAVLFIGAGGSRGAKNGSNEDIPLAKDLAAELVTKFLGAEYAGADFRAAYDLSCSQRDVPTVQRYLYDRLSPFEPAAFHLIIPTLVWSGLITTNYDLIIERSYRKAAKPVQKLIPNVKDGDGATTRLDQRSVLYVKLHGCLTKHNEVHPPLIASTEQLIAFKEGRQGQFDTFLEWGKTKSIIFVGYSFLDPNLRALFNEIIREGDNRPRHYIANKDMRPAEATYWADRRVTALDISFEDLLLSLDAEVPDNKRQLSLLAARTLHTTSFTRFITAPGQHESEDLKTYLASMIEHVSSDLRGARDDPSKFYKGFDLGWYPIEADLDVRRGIVNELLTEQVIPTPPSERASIVVLKGHAGSGKSVALRRVAWEAAKQHNRLCLFVARTGVIDVERFDEIFSLTNVPIYLFIDDVAEHREHVLELIELVRRRRAAVRIICTESFSLWNALCEDLEPRVTEEYEMRYLSERDIDDLIQKLQKHGCLGHLEGLPADKRKHEFKYVYGRQLLVALLEATHGVPLVEIIANEYDSIHPPEAKILYLDICSLNRFGPPVRAGIISRIHNMSFDQFKDEFFKRLEQIVSLRTDPKSGDYVYEARHPFIAGHVYEFALKSQEERFDNLIRILSKLNPSFSYDLDAIARLVRASNVEKTVSDPVRGRKIYDTAITSAGRLPVTLHQRGIYEMHVATSFADLNRAEQYMNEALQLEPYNKTMKHSLAELDLRRSRLAMDQIEKVAWRKRAGERAASLTNGSVNSYPHSTLVKIAIDDVRDALAAAEASDNEASVQLLGDSIAKAEETLKRSLQQFPNDAVLLTLEGELSAELSQAERTETAFKRALKANPNSMLVARRLARIQNSKGAHSEAIATLRASLEANPASADLQNDLAMSLMRSTPNADQTAAEEILYHLRRAFTPGDKNYQAQFQYARELCLVGKYEEARPIFAKMAEMKISFRQKKAVRAYVLDDKGNRRILDGTILVLKPTFGFIQCPAPALNAYFEVDELNAAPEKITTGMPVTFELGFNLQGPVAVNVTVAN